MKFWYRTKTRRWHWIARGATSALVAFFCSHCILTCAQNAVVSVFPEKSETGDTFTVKILVSGTQVMPGRVRFTPWQTFIPKENMLRSGGWQRSGNQWVQQYTLIVFDSMRVELPPLYVPTHLGNSLPTNALLLHIFPTPVAADLSDVAPIRDIRREPVYWTDYWPWAAGVLALMALLWLRQRRRKPPVRPVAVVSTVAVDVPLPVPAHQMALQALRQLEEQQLWKKQEADPHFTQISRILRAYLEQRYQFPALESTTREIAEALRRTSLPELLKAPLQNLLQGTDSVKYALSKPTEAVYREALQKARQFVEQTASP